MEVRVGMQAFFVLDDGEVYRGTVITALGADGMVVLHMDGKADNVPYPLIKAKTVHTERREVRSGWD